MRKIIITADDFGFSEKINKGIIATVEQGVTTEVSLMMNSFGSNNAMKYAKDNDWKNVGIHLSLFDISKQEKPFRSADYNQILNKWGPTELIERIKNEIGKYEDYFQTTPSHITGHKQLQLDPKVIDFVLDYAQKNNIYVRKWGDFDTDTIVVSNIKKAQASFSKYNIMTSDFLFGFKYNFKNPTKATHDYEKLIKQTKEDSIIEILFHPGYYGNFETQYTSFLKEREADRELLCSQQFREMLRKYQTISIKDF